MVPYSSQKKSSLSTSREGACKGDGGCVRGGGGGQIGGSGRDWMKGFVCVAEK